jgi:protein TonB
MDRTPRANWLLRTLIIISVGVHGLILVHLSGIYRSSTLTYIEMSLQNIGRPSTRHIPRPRPRPKAPEPQDQVRPLNVVQRPLPRFKPLVMASMETNVADSLVEGIAAPAIPQTPGVESAGWIPAPQPREPAVEFMTTASYLDMVRLKIESRKRYPETAKAGSIEGRVTIRFILVTDGSVRDVAVVKGARYSALNAAALDAVKNAAPFPRPPANLFPGDLALKLTIVFELT